MLHHFTTRSLWQFICIHPISDEPYPYRHILHHARVRMSHTTDDSSIPVGSCYPGQLVELALGTSSCLTRALPMHQRLRRTLRLGLLLQPLLLYMGVPSERSLSERGTNSSKDDIQATTHARYHLTKAHLSTTDDNILVQRHSLCTASKPETNLDSTHDCNKLGSALCTAFQSRISYSSNTLPYQLSLRHPYASTQ